MASISQRQVQLLKSQFLQSIGQSKDIGELPVVEGILKEVAKVFLETAVDNANKSNSIDTGAIVDDLTFTIEKGNGYTLTVGYPPNSPAAKYFDFVNKGVAGVGKVTDSPYQFKSKNPSKAHVSAIAEWIKRGKMKTSASDVSRYGLTKQESKYVNLRQKGKTQSLAYVVARSIKIKGLKATRYFDDAIMTVFGDGFRKVLSEALAADISIQIRSINGN